eukprot:TRINITY_DN5070_c0_g1_i1.p1 TRINITY_DN5070_c0_g1~~TRINITY_DN5070_c0_g1_i1.p1  ORF type:complete len:214 (-),score=44.61 TRINITY_DN5070_c0_g1_i1:30-671(-)
MSRSPFKLSRASKHATLANKLRPAHDEQMHALLCEFVDKTYKMPSRRDTCQRVLAVEAHVLCHLHRISFAKYSAFVASADKVSLPKSTVQYVTERLRNDEALAACFIALCDSVRKWSGSASEPAPVSAPLSPSGTDTSAQSALPLPTAPSSPATDVEQQPDSPQPDCLFPSPQSESQGFDMPLVSPQQFLMSLEFPFVLPSPLMQLPTLELTF